MTPDDFTDCRDRTTVRRLVNTLLSLNGLVSTTSFDLDPAAPSPVQEDPLGFNPYRYRRW